MIDPNIALNVKPIVVPDAARQFAESEGLAQQRALRNQQLQEGAQNLQRLQRTNEEQAMDQQDQLKLRQVYSDANGDPEATVKGAIASGVSPKNVQALQQHFADYAQKIAKTKADELPVIAARDNKMLGLHDEAIQLASTDPQKFAQQYPQFYARAVQIDPEAAQHLDPNTPPTVDQLKLSELGYKTHTSFLSQEEEKRKQAQELRAQTEESRKKALFPGQLTEQQSTIAQGKEKIQSIKDADNAKLLATAAAGGPQQVAATLQQLQAKGEDISKFAGIPMDAKPETFLNVAMAPHEIVSSTQTASHNAAMEANQKLQQTIARGHLAVSQADLALKQKQNEQEYGKDTADYWAHQLLDNPDSIQELPAKMRTSVGEKFKQISGGKPLPTKLTGQPLQAENASRNALDNIDFIREALKNPEIKQRIGPILGRLGSAEQTVGSAVGLSPEAEQLAQELRTRMRYFVFQEGKSVLGGRLPTQLVKDLEGSSANVHMDPNTLLGALKGAEGSAMSTLDNADKQRFGGQMRSREQRGLGNRGNIAPQKVYTQGDIDDAVAQHQGLTADQAEAAFKAKGWVKK